MTVLRACSAGIRMPLVLVLVATSFEIRPANVSVDAFSIGSNNVHRQTSTCQFPTQRQLPPGTTKSIVPIRNMLIMMAFNNRDILSSSTEPNEENYSESTSTNRHYQKILDFVDSWSFKLLIPSTVWILFLLTITGDFSEGANSMLFSKQQEDQLLTASAISITSVSLWSAALLHSWRKKIIASITNIEMIREECEKGRRAWEHIFATCRDIAQNQGMATSTKIRNKGNFDCPKNMKIPNNECHKQQLLLGQLADALWSFPKSVEYQLQQRCIALDDDGKNYSDDEITDEEEALTLAASNFAEQLQLVLAEDTSSSTLLIQDLMHVEDKPRRSLEEIIYATNALTQDECNGDNNVDHVFNAISTLGDAVTACEESVLSIHHHQHPCDQTEASSQEATISNMLIGSFLFALPLMALLSQTISNNRFPVDTLLATTTGEIVMMIAIPTALLSLSMILSSSLCVAILAFVSEEFLIQKDLSSQKAFFTIMSPDDGKKNGVSSLKGKEVEVDIAAWKEFSTELHNLVDLSSSNPNGSNDASNACNDKKSGAAYSLMSTMMQNYTAARGLSSFTISRQELSDGISAGTRHIDDHVPSYIDHLCTGISTDDCSLAGLSTFTIPRSEVIEVTGLPDLPVALNTNALATNMYVATLLNSGAGMTMASDVDAKAFSPPTVAMKSLSTSAPPQSTIPTDCVQGEEFIHFLDESLEDFLKNQGKREV